MKTFRDKAPVSVFVDSAYRDKSLYPNQADFVVGVESHSYDPSFRSGNGIFHSNPFGLGQPIFIARVFSYYNKDPSQGYKYAIVRVDDRIDRNEHNKGRTYLHTIEIIDQHTHVVKGRTRVLGDASYLFYLENPIPGTNEDDFVVFRQSDEGPFKRFKTGVVHPKGSLDILIPDGSDVDNFYAGMMLMFFHWEFTSHHFDMETDRLHSYLVTKYDGTTKTATLNKPLADDYDGNDPIELYQTIDFTRGTREPPGIGGVGARAYDVTLNFLRIPYISFGVEFETIRHRRVDPFFTYRSHVENFDRIYLDLYTPRGSDTSSLVTNDPDASKATFVLSTNDHSASDYSSLTFSTLSSTQVNRMYYSFNEPLGFRLRLPNGIPVVYDTYQDGQKIDGVGPDFRFNIVALFTFTPVNEN